MITVARWFGGTKLGTGGLVHAYTEAAQAALINVETAELIPMSQLNFTVSYPLYEIIKRKLAEHGFAITHEEFTSNIKISGEIRTDAVELLQKTLTDISNGTVFFSK